MHRMWGSAGVWNTARATGPAQAAGWRARSVAEEACLVVAGPSLVIAQAHSVPAERSLVAAGPSLVIAEAHSTPAEAR